MRILAVFEKGERIRHIGHLDIQRSMQRGLRRSGLPVAYSNGFNPHILITFASALSTGACAKIWDMSDSDLSDDDDTEQEMQQTKSGINLELATDWDEEMYNVSF